MATMAVNQGEYEFFGASTDLTPGKIQCYQFLKIYRHINLFDVKWNTNLESIPKATDSQIKQLISDSGNDRALQKALGRMILSDSEYFNITMRDGGSDKLGKVIMCGARINGRRNLFICDFEQCVAMSMWGVLTTLGFGAAMSAVFSPMVGFVAVLSKLEVDYKVSKEVVAIVAGLKYLEERGLIKIVKVDGKLRVLMGRNMNL